MSVFALGLNHQSAPLDLRGKFAFSLEQLAPTLMGFRAQVQDRHPRQAAPEAAIISTCNRTELYVAGGTALVQPAVNWLASVGGVGQSALMDHAYVMENSAAARHAFRVASGLDSMVLGEPQILGQMKQAVREADQAGTLGTTLHQLFQRSFSVAKEVRTSTEIGTHSISMAAASVRLAAQLFEDLGDIRVLFVGAGEMIELVATHFAARTPRAMAVAN
ncbi:MAG: glutamyl-tRNA reductase, partial [Paucibacter sp.]|nr:glutamyl-tRNA reductase [Roseateles sp.]